uniref:Uncharacterized protein n=1 Tax=Panagrolaimus sp. JU765 TaxID=591449 RepID=A0AC34Q4L3_9BILA
MQKLPILLILLLISTVLSLPTPHQIQNAPLPISEWDPEPVITLLPRQILESSDEAEITRTLDKPRAVTLPGI